MIQSRVTSGPSTRSVRAVPKLASFGRKGEIDARILRTQAYLNRTSILFPIPPSVYRPLPGWFKQTVLLDLPMYKFDEDKDGKEALEEQRKQRREEA